MINIEELAKQTRQKFKLEFEDDYPIAYAIWHNRQSVVLCCPYCGEIHYHGDGYTGQVLEGHRVRHCHIQTTNPKKYQEWTWLHPETARLENNGYIVRAM